MTASGDVLGTAVSGLLSFQRAIATTGHNITNANTEGYSRQRVEMATLKPFGTGSGYIGTGVHVTGIKRLYDDFLGGQVVGRTSLNAQFENFQAFASQVDNLLGSPEASLSPVMQDFFNAMQDVANDPTSIPARQLLLSQGDTLANRFHTLNQRLEGLRAGTNQQLQLKVEEINSLAQNVAKLNKDIALADGYGDNLPNDLLDQRNLAIEKLAELTSVNTVPQDDGSINVFIGTGQNLVLGNSASSLAVTQNKYDPTQLDVGINLGGTLVDMTNQLSGGAIGGLFEFRHDVLDATQNALGRIAVGLSESYNQQHRAGMDLNNQLGGDFFNDLTSATVLPNRTNTGNAVVTADITDISALTTGDYILAQTSGVYSLKNVQTGTITTLATFPGGAETIDGITLNLASGAMLDGDSIMIRPTRTASTDIDMVLTSPDEIAAAAPVRTSTTSANTGSGEISAGEVLDATDPALLNTVRIEFTAANQYDVVDETSGSTLASGVAYSNGANIDYNGWRVQINGSPQTGDIFRVEYNANGVSDNRNMLKLFDLQKQGTLVNGSASYQQTYAQLVGDVGSKTRQANINGEAQKALLNQAIEAHKEISGVNLDEEAANLVKFQQAYQAAAQVITISDSIFQTLINAVRR
jgi:flagellar hook-associated protein 1 FlgK